MKYGPRSELQRLKFFCRFTITMSLCGIWRDPADKLFLFSDSRISKIEEPTSSKSNQETKVTYSDTGVKIISVPVNITDPADSDRLIYPWNIGLCFAGDCISAYILVLCLSQILQSLELDPLHGKLSFEAIADLVRKAYQVVAREQFNNGLIMQSELPDII